MYYHNNELPPQQEWICPKCGRVNAPWMPTCGCVSSQTSGTGAPYLVKTIPISRDSHEVDTPQTERSEQMKIGDEVFVHGYIDEIRNDTIIIRNVGGYFGTSRDEVFYYEEDERGYGTMNEADRKTENSSEKPNNLSEIPTGSERRRKRQD